jgi:hypothetical protein
MVITPDAATEQRIQRQLDRGTFREPADLLAHALDLVEAQNVMDDWLLRNKEAIQADLDESFAEEARGESYSPDEAPAILAASRANIVSRLEESIAQADCGEGITGEELRARFAARKAA